MKKRGIVAVIVLLLIGLDQLVKNYVVQQIPLGEVRLWIPNLVSLTYLQNRGAAFSMLQDQQWFFAVITLVVMAGAIWYLHKHMEDLADLPTVRFTQEKDEYLYYSENFVDTSASSQMFNVTDRATLNGILERTDAYATGSGFLDSDSVNGITVIRLKDNLDNRMVYVKREEVELSQAGTLFVEVMQEYFDQKRKS